MSLVSVHADFTKVANALERIAEALERLAPPIMYDREKLEILDLKDMHNVIDFKPTDRTDETEWQRFAPRNNYD